MMRRELLQATGLLLFSPPGSAGLAPVLPSPEAAMDDRIAYAPDVVGVGRLFLIALKLPPDALDVPVTMPDSVTMFDHSRPDLTPPPPSLQGKGESPGDPGDQSGGGHRPPSPSREGVRHFYFRALKPAERAEIR